MPHQDFTHKEYFLFLVLLTWYDGNVIYFLGNHNLNYVSLYMFVLITLFVLYSSLLKEAQP